MDGEEEAGVVWTIGVNDNINPKSGLSPKGENVHV